MTRWVNEKETAEMTGIALPTLRNGRSQGFGIPFVKIGRSVRYSLEDIQTFMLSHRIIPKGRNIPDPQADF